MDERLGSLWMREETEGKGKTQGHAPKPINQVFIHVLVSAGQ